MCCPAEPQTRCSVGQLWHRPPGASGRNLLLLPDFWPQKPGRASGCLKLNQKNCSREWDRNRSHVPEFCPHFLTFYFILFYCFKPEVRFAECACLYQAAQHSCNYKHSHAGAASSKPPVSTTGHCADWGFSALIKETLTVFVGGGEAAWGWGAFLTHSLLLLFQLIYCFQLRSWRQHFPSSSLSFASFLCCHAIIIHFPVKIIKSASTALLVESPSSTTFPWEIHHRLTTEDN